ncbi:recombinase family protein [Streptomyces endophyticus]|uniref:Recombinase family protein n=1 Tax=Streptomyces endophyticus TaxID=714166 RepID=A0ABU6FAA5_9ACTN|nr:recombinase family protein [Streptomyces endophyticus]MEB8340974.1 recombinase family protein [Streptomyces endophyticus]
MAIVASLFSAGEERLRVVTYRRVSTPGQLEGSGLEEQGGHCKAWLAAHPDADVFGEYTDEAASGVQRLRPGLEQLVRDARSGNFNRVLVSSVDRVGRTARAAYQWAWDMADLGVHVVSVLEEIDTSTEAGWAEFRRHVSYSDMEWRRIRQRTVAGRESTISYGGWPGGPAPYGYRIASDVVDVDGGRRALSVLVTDERESAVISVAAALLIDQGMNCGQAAAELNERGMPTRSGRPWEAANLRARLSGETIHQGYVVYRKTSRGASRSNTRRTESGDPLHGTPVRIGVPPILTQKRARQLMEALRRTGFQNGRRSNRAYPLSGRLHGECGETYFGATEGDRRVYRCRGRLTGLCCEPNLRADEIEAAVLGGLFGLLRDKECLAGGAIRDRYAAASGDRVQYERRMREIDQAVACHEELLLREMPEYVAAGVAPVVLQAAAERMQEELDDLRRQRVVAAEWLAGREAHDARRDELLDTIAIGASCIAALGPVQVRELFEAFDVEVHCSTREDLYKKGSRCPVGAWHEETGTLVPPDPTDEEWLEVLAALRPFFTKRHFTSKYDIRQQFNGMLHRLRNGLSWTDLPPTWGPTCAIRERQLSWWKKGAWPAVMAVLHAAERGEPVYRRSVVPPFRIITSVGEGGTDSSGMRVGGGAAA